MHFFSFDSSGSNTARALGLRYTAIGKPVAAKGYSKDKQVNDLLRHVSNGPLNVIDLGVSGATSSLLLKKLREYLYVYRVYATVVHKKALENFAFTYVVIIPGKSIWKMTRHTLFTHKKLQIRHGRFQTRWKPMCRNCCKICKAPCQGINLPERLGEIIVVESILAYTFEASIKGITKGSALDACV